jgi:hypothetical protein
MFPRRVSSWRVRRGAANAAEFGDASAAAGRRNKDLFFRYFVSLSEPVKVETCAPLGFPAGTPFGAVVAGVDDGARIGSLGGVGGNFRVRLRTPLSPSIDRPGGPGTVRVRNVGGMPDAPFLSIFTRRAGSIPSEPFLGIDPAFVEPSPPIASGGPPFVGVLDSTGASSFGP